MRTNGADEGRAARPKVLLCGPPPRLDALARRLEARGTDVARGELPGPVPDLAGVALAVLAVFPDEDPVAEATVERFWADCQASDVPVLPWHVRGPVSVTGPLMDRDAALCPPCLGAALDLAGPAPDAAEDTAAALAGQQEQLYGEVLAMLEGRAAPRVRAVRLDTRTGAASEGLPMARPDCTVCRPHSARPAGSVPSAAEAELEELLALVVGYELSCTGPGTPAAPDAAQPSARTLDRAQDRPAARLPLPERFRYSRALAEPSGPRQLPRRGSVGADHLALLLARTVGLREEFAEPAPFTVHVAVRGMPGIEDGCYDYSADAHALLRAGAGNTTTDELIGGSSGALLVCTAAPARLAARYGAGLTRSVMTETGAGLARLVGSAAALGRRIELLDRLDTEDLTGLRVGLGLDPDRVREPIVAVVRMSATPGRPDPLPAPPPAVPAGRPGRVPGAVLPLPPDRDRLVAGLVTGAATVGVPQPVPERYRVGHGLPVPSEAMPPDTPPRLPAALTLTMRRQVQAFADVPLPQRVLVGGLPKALWSDATLHPGEAAAGNGLELLVLARSVTGVRPGVYRVAGEGPGWRWLGEFSQECWQDATGTPGHARAGALLVAVGSIAAATARHGVRGYGMLLRRAGLVVETAWLSAIARDAVGAPLPVAALGGAVAGLSSLDPFTRRPLTGVILGREEGAVVD
ncbi:hypothetical protein [Kitasatospora sp. NPDC093102]|uniref:hypothetical protein n=1 Tax=Kitasatospora sp. NPDC093102 TaxID=3155069 RepID=UPI003420BB9B